MAYVLLINGSPHKNGCVSRALEEVQKTLEENGVETELVQAGRPNLPGCKACGYCSTHEGCVFQDLVNETAPKFEKADGIVVGSPTYYAHANGQLLAFLDRLFYSTGFDKTMKVGAAVISSRRGGSTSAFDDINKYFTISSMPIVSSTYWNEVHGFTPDQVEKDLEGLQTMRNLGRNMAFLVKSIALGREKFGQPEQELKSFTCFHDGL